MPDLTWWGQSGNVTEVELASSEGVSDDQPVPGPLGEFLRIPHELRFRYNDGLLHLCQWYNRKPVSCEGKLSDSQATPRWLAGIKHF